MQQNICSFLVFKPHGEHEGADEAAGVFLSLVLQMLLGGRGHHLEGTCQNITVLCRDLMRLRKENSFPAWFQTAASVSSGNELEP